MKRKSIQLFNKQWIRSIQKFEYKRFNTQLANDVSHGTSQRFYKTNPILAEDSKHKGEFEKDGSEMNMGFGTIPTQDDNNLTKVKDILKRMKKVKTTKKEKKKEINLILPDDEEKLGFMDELEEDLLDELKGEEKKYKPTIPPTTVSMHWDFTSSQATSIDSFKTEDSNTLFAYFEPQELSVENKRVSFITKIFQEVIQLKIAKEDLKIYLRTHSQHVNTYSEREQVLNLLHTLIMSRSMTKSEKEHAIIVLIEIAQTLNSHYLVRELYNQIWNIKHDPMYFNKPSVLEFPMNLWIHSTAFMSFLKVMDIKEHEILKLFARGYRRLEYLFSKYPDVHYSKVINELEVDEVMCFRKMLNNLMQYFNRNSFKSQRILDIYQHFLYDYFTKYPLLFQTPHLLRSLVNFLTSIENYHQSVKGGSTMYPNIGLQFNLESIQEILQYMFDANLNPETEHLQEFQFNVMMYSSLYQPKLFTTFFDKVRISNKQTSLDYLGLLMFLLLVEKNRVDHVETFEALKVRSIYKLKYDNLPQYIADTMTKDNRDISKDFISGMASILSENQDLRALQCLGLLSNQAPLPSVYLTLISLFEDYNLSGIVTDLEMEQLIKQLMDNIHKASISASSTFIEMIRTDPHEAMCLGRLFNKVLKKKLPPSILKHLFDSCRQSLLNSSNQAQTTSHLPINHVRSILVILFESSLIEPMDYKMASQIIDLLKENNMQPTMGFCSIFMRYLKLNPTNEFIQLRTKIRNLYPRNMRYTYNTYIITSLDAMKIKQTMSKIQTMYVIPRYVLEHAITIMCKEGNHHAFTYVELLRKQIRSNQPLFRNNVIVYSLFLAFHESARSDEYTLNKLHDVYTEYMMELSQPVRNDKRVYSGKINEEFKKDIRVVNMMYSLLAETDERQASYQDDVKNATVQHKKLYPSINNPLL
mmetsp:Transcript_8896/g.13211  ORF Transcript_8896/g.13211 Transcript_8896/m.13211 type:complete len:925 (-) Transcript_8896:378-3152(-)